MWVCQLPWRFLSILKSSTPIDAAKIPDISLVIKASESIGSALKKGDTVVYESTV
jgi:UDP-N-acetyl-D-galactosamine dehydrogenase